MKPQFCKTLNKLNFPLKNNDARCTHATTPRKPCVLNAPTMAHIMEQEALFWTGLYRCIDENLLDEFIAPIDLIKLVFSGKRCYFFYTPTDPTTGELRLKRWPENIFPTYVQNVTDYHNEIKAMIRKPEPLRSRIIQTVRIKTGLNSRPYHRFNPGLRAVGIYAVTEGIASLDELQDHLMDYTELDMTEPYFYDMIAGTKECIRQRRICDVPRKKKSR